MNVDNIDVDDVADKEFEIGLEEMASHLYKDIEIAFKKIEKSYSKADISEETCNILSELFNKIDKKNTWEFNVTYESMKDLYNRNNMHTEL